MSAAKIKIVHVINSFEFGGAEAMLCNLLLRTDRDRFEPSVVSLIDDLSVAGPLLDAKIPIAVMGMRPGIPDPRGVARLARHLRRVRPAVVSEQQVAEHRLGAAVGEAVDYVEEADFFCGPPARPFVLESKRFAWLIPPSPDNRGEGLFPLCFTRRSETVGGEGRAMRSLRFQI
jgi:hypothetical protein